MQVTCSSSTKQTCRSSPQSIYYSRAPPYEMVAQIGGRGLSHEMAGVGNDQVREVEEVGMGCCCLVNTRVFHRIVRKLDWQCFF
jgi:hypothetical protein